MRYFKIFIIAFLSLIGVVGGVVGIMYLTGALNQKVVEPEAIYFEYTDNQTAYNLADDAYIKILSGTEEVTETQITLSLGAASSQEGIENGVTYITDGIIKVPKFVTLGNAFKIELCKEINLELGGEEWIVGGVSTLTAKSQSLKASQITTNVNVDVPVHSITVSTYANDSYADEVGAFAAGETFYAKANFKPAASAYKFGQDGLNNRPLVMKKVYFDPISSSLTESIVPNTEINNTLTNQGITNIQAFNAVSATENLTVYAYAFASAILEDACIETTQGDEDLILAQLKNTNVGTSAQKPLEIENVLINSFTITPSLTVKTLKFNEVNTIYANFAESSSSLNFGVKISSTNPQSAPNLQSKIKNIGVQVYQKSGSGYTKANSNSFVFVDTLGAKLEPVGDGYYFPTLISANVNKSYWNFVPLHAGVEYAFSLTILDNKYEPEVDPITTFDAQTMQNWQSSSIVNSTISWTNQDNINLTVIDSQDEESVRSEEFDLSSITSFTQGTYSIVHYIAYANEQDVDLSQVISGARKAENYSNAALSLPENINIYELSSATIKLLPSTIASFNVRAVVLENDYLGRLTNPLTIFSATQPKTVNIHKTVKSLSVNIEVLNQDLVKNYNTETKEPLKKLAFLMGTNENIFDIVFTVSATSKDSLEKEVEIFLQDFENGKIVLSTYVEPQDQKNAISTLEGTAKFVSDTIWEYRIPYFAGFIDVDSQISFEYTYQQTEFIAYSNQIKDVVFPEGSSLTMADNITNAVIELYDGKVFTLEFGYENTQETPITQTTQITGTETCAENVYFAESIERKYYFEGAEPQGLLDETGEFAVIAKDKFGNKIDASNYNCNAEVDNNGTRTTYYLLSAQDYSSALKVSPTDKLYFVDESGIGSVEVKYNQGSVSKGIWTPSNIASDYTALSEEQINGEISISRFGVKGQEIQISGNKGLLSVRYIAENIVEQTTTQYELCNLVNYTIISPQTAYKDVIKFNFDEDNFLNSISILESISTQISLNISATTELGTTYSIKLSIKPNITISFSRLTAQGGLSSDPQRENNVNYFLMYSNNDVVFNLSVTFNLAEELSLTISEGLFTNETNKITETPTFNDDDNKVTIDYQFVLNFSKDRLGKQHITISANPDINNQYVFNATLNVVVEPNVAFEETTLNKVITIKSFAEKYSVITDEDLKRILGEEGLTIQDVVISFAKTTEGEVKDKVYKNNSLVPLDYNIFEYDSQNNQLSLLNSIDAKFDPSGEYTAYFEVKYGTVIIGEIKVKIASNISVNSLNTDYSTRFAYFNAKEYLVLQSGETGISLDYIQNLFNSVDKIEFIVDGNYVSLQEDKYDVKFTNNYVLCEEKNITLWLYDTEISNGEELIVSKVNFPVLISPVDTKYVTYLNAPPFNGQSEGLSDFSSLKDYTLLFSQNVYDVYKSGEDVSLVMQNGKQFGLSLDLISQIASGNYPYAICLQGENGQITTTQYGSFNKTTGVLTTLPSSQDAFVYFVVYDSNQQTNIIALYRFKVEANVAISVYYPYANNYQVEESTQNAEYIYETLGEEITINLLEPLSNNYPNFGHKRIELSVYDEESKGYKETTAKYTANFTLVSVNGITELGTIKVNYGISLANNVLTIGKNNPSRVLEIVLNCALVQAGVDMGNVNYIIRLNSTQTFSVKLGSQDFTEKTLTISKGEVFDYSPYQLYKQDGYIWQPATDVDLNVYYYIENADVKDFIKEENKKLSLSDAAVSDKNVTFMFYTIYGEIHKLNLTFVSDYAAEIKTNNVITLNPNTNALEVYADTEFNLRDVISLTKNQSQTINLTDTNIDIVYYDNGNFVESDIVLFPQIATNQETHDLKVIIKLSEAGLGLKEDYEFNITLNVLKSIVSNYSNSPYEVEHITYNTTYKTSGYIFSNLLSEEFTDNVFLFESANQDVLKGYELTATISSNASGFASLDNSTSTLTKVYTDIQSIKDAFYVYLLKAPDDNNISITITFTLSQTYPNNSVSTLKAYLKLVVVPDVSIAFSYPKANTQSTKQQESIFLSKQNYGPTQTKQFGFMSDENYFGGSRISLDWKNGVDNSRVTITATCDGNILINEQTDSLTFGINDTVNLSWNSSQQPTQDMHAEVTFKVFVDEIYRGEYVIVFESNINKIFEVSSLLNLYDNAKANSELNPEIYYVDTKSIQGIFSRKTALLTFTNKAQAADVTLNAYAKGENSQKSLLGTITIGKTEQEINWLLFNTNIEIKEDLSNVVIQDEASNTEYHFGTDYTDPHNVMYRTAFIKQNSVSLKYRIGATYLNEQLSTTNLERVLKAETSPLTSYSINRSKATDLKELAFKVDGESLSKKYYYQVIYDFKASNAFSTKLGEISNKVAKTITAPNSIGGNLANSAFGISAITGPFTKEYFQTHNVNYFAEIIMITNSQFETSQTSNNVNYIADGKLWFLQQYFSSLTAVSNSAPCAATSLYFDKFNNNKVYDFDLTAHGAENNGNYVYILVSYGTGTEAVEEITAENVSKFAFAIIKVKIEPNASSIELYNTDGNLNGAEPEQNQVITYENGRFSDLKLGANGATKADNNLIYIYGSGTTNLINDITGNNATYLNLYGELANYVEIDKQSNGAVYLKQKQDDNGNYLMATYGDKSGFIQIEDMYGYKENYYITLKAANQDEAITLVEGSGAFIGQINGSQNNFYTGTEIMFIDANASVSLGEKGGVRAYNFNKLEEKVKNSTLNNIWTYQITFKIPEINFIEEKGVVVGSDSPQTTFTVPSISESSKPVTLEIYITVSHNGAEEVILLQAPMIIQKRFILTNTYNQNSSVQAGVSFDLSEYLSVQDAANLGSALGQASISGNVLTLRVKESAKDKKLTLSAVHDTDKNLDSNISITVGANFDGTPLSATNGYYYYILPLLSTYQNINFEDFKFSISSQESGFEVAGNAEFVADKIVTLITSSVVGTPTVYVAINNGKNAYAIPYTLSKNGQQVKSLAEEKAKATLVNFITHSPEANPLIEITSCGYNDVEINKDNTIYKYNLASTPVSAEDMQTIKNFEIYDDSLVIKITNTNEIALTQLDLTVEILLDGNVVGSATYKVIENISHYRYISVYDIFYEAFNLAENFDKEFTVRITYYESQNNLKSIISYNNQPAVYTKPIGNRYEYSLTSTFKFNKLEAGLTEKLDVLSASAFTDKIYSTKKYYLVKYLDQKVFESAQVQFNVTPKYYGLSINEETTKFVYANQYTVNSAGIYTVDFNTWTSGINLVNRAGNVLNGLSNDLSLTFKINDGIGAGSGSASLDENWNLITTSSYKETEYFAIEVWVPVTNEESIFIGRFKVELSHNYVYVTNTNVTYMFIITHPAATQTIEPTYYFTENATKISDLLFGENSTVDKDIVNKDTQTIIIEGMPRKITECNISIVTIIDQIYSVNYVIEENDNGDNDEYLDLKLKLNQTSSTDKKTVELQFDATSKIDKSTISRQELGLPAIKLTITKQSNVNDLIFDITSVNGSKCEYVGNGVYNLKLPFKEVFENMIGADYLFSAKVVGTMSTNAELLYAKRTQEQSSFTGTETFFFALSFVGMDNSVHHTLLASKYLESMFETDGYFTLNLNIEDIQNNPVMLDNFVVLSQSGTALASNVKYYTIKFLGAQNIDLLGNDILISSHNSTNASTTYSIAKVLIDSALQALPSYAFEIKINSEEIYNQVISNAYELSLTVYNADNTVNIDGKYLPKVIPLNLMNTSTSVLAIEVNGAQQQTVVAVEPNGAQQVMFDISSWLASGDYVTITDISSKFANLAPASGDNFFKLSGSYSSIIVKASLTKAEKTGYNHYVFDNASVLKSNTITQITDNYDLTSLVVTPTANNFYSFAVQNASDASKIKYFMAKADENGLIKLSLLELSELLKDYASGEYFFAGVSGIENTSSLSEKTVYALTSTGGNITIKAFELTKVSNNLYISSANILDGFISAKQLTNKFSITALETQTTYISTTTSLETTYLAVYYSEAANIDIISDVTSLNVGDEIVISISTNGFSALPLNSIITFKTTQSDAEKKFDVVIDGEVIETKTIATGEVSVVIDTSQPEYSGITTINNLTIVAS